MVPQEAKLEIDVMKALDHPNCLRLLGSGILPHESVSSFKNVFMVFPIVEVGRLSNPFVPWNALFFVSKEILWIFFKE